MNVPEQPGTLFDIYHRRSIRSYLPQPVDKATLERLLDAAVQAPTALHAEPWGFAVVQDRALMQRYSERAKSLFLAEPAPPGMSPEAKKAMLEAAQKAEKAGVKVSLTLSDAFCVARFRDEFYPRLRHLAPVTSSDGAFTPPEISGPTLVMRTAQGAGHVMDLDWEWAYQIGDSPLRVPLDASGDDSGYRDPEAERAVLASIEHHVPRPERKRITGATPSGTGGSVLPGSGRHVPS